MQIRVNSFFLYVIYANSFACNCDVVRKFERLPLGFIDADFLQVTRKKVVCYVAYYVAYTRWKTFGEIYEIYLRL